MPRWYSIVNPLCYIVIHVDQSGKGVYIRWNGMVEWNSGMVEWNSGMVEWNSGMVSTFGGMEWWNGIVEWDSGMLHRTYLIVQHVLYSEQ